MIIFWLICAALIAIGLAFILPTLLHRDQSEAETSKQQANVAVYRDQLNELEADLKNGLVSQEQYQQDRDEIERRLLEDVSATVVRKAKPAATRSRAAAYAIAFIIPIGAVAFYLLLGNPAALSGAAAQPGAPNGQMSQAGIEANVGALAKRLEQNPDDAEGWAMLSRSYLNLAKYKEASDAYARATSLNPTDADLLTEYAFVVAMNNDRQLQGQPQELIKRALEIAPENPKALELAGSAEFQAKNYDQAIAYWQKLLAKTSADSEVGQTVSQRIEEARALKKSK